jgi:hypothetical protein
MRREARRSTPGRACFLSTRRYPLGTHLGLRHLKPYNQACSPCGDTNASQRNSMLRTSRCRLRCFMTTIIPGLVEHGGQPFIALPSMERDHIASLSMGSDHLPRQAWSDHIASLSLGQQSTAWSDHLASLSLGQQSTAWTNPTLLGSMPVRPHCLASLGQQSTAWTNPTLLGSMPVRPHCLASLGQQSTAWTNPTLLGSMPVRPHCLASLGQQSTAWTNPTLPCYAWHCLSIISWCITRRTRLEQGDMHTSGLISSDYPMASTHRDVIPTNARQQARIGSCFERLLGNKNALGHVFSDYPKNVAVGCRNAFPSTIVGSFRDPSGSISYPQGHLVHFFVRYSMGLDSTRH